MCKNKVQFQKGLSLPDFMDKFGTEAQCQAALEAAKWPNGFSCAYCGHHSFSRITRGRAKRQCNKCKHQTSNLPYVRHYFSRYQTTIDQVVLGYASDDAEQKWHLANGACSSVGYWN